MAEIRERRNTGTWCGFPHNLLLPRYEYSVNFSMNVNYRSQELSDEDSLSDAQKFVIIAFVNDVDQSVTEGSDGIEHMYVKKCS